MTTYDRNRNAITTGSRVMVSGISQERGLTVIAVLHDINMAARYCDYLVALRGGEMIAQGTPAEIMRGETLEMIYGIPMGIFSLQCNKGFYDFSVFSFRFSASSGVTCATWRDL